AQEAGDGQVESAGDLTAQRQGVNGNHDLVCVDRTQLNTNFWDYSQVHTNFSVDLHSGSNGHCPSYNWKVKPMLRKFELNAVCIQQVLRGNGDCQKVVDVL